MRYAALGPGKRIRPFFVLTGARMFGVPETSALRVAAAVELVHAYSLVHDALPAMDAPDMRRGRPRVHRQLAEAPPLPAGHPPQALAFAVPPAPATPWTPQVTSALISHPPAAAGPPRH